LEKVENAILETVDSIVFAWNFDKTTEDIDGKGLDMFMPMDSTKPRCNDTSVKSIR
jgi:hypothetical protein